MVLNPAILLLLKSFSLVQGKKALWMVGLDRYGLGRCLSARLEDDRIAARQNRAVSVVLAVPFHVANARRPYPLVKVPDQQSVVIQNGQNHVLRLLALDGYTKRESFHRAGGSLPGS